MKGKDFKKQTSVVSAARAFEVLQAGGFIVATYSELPEVKKAYRKDVLAARRRFGDFAAISTTGRSLTMIGCHVETGHVVDVMVPLEDMLGHGALEALERKTGLVFLP
ncbi:MAG: hypothetical protein KDJ26_02220 [Alphaproteobacteria bacterium]|jgi:hypothetical protein|nr:hypothetical protein [Alphaproteobacteria bacterium]MCB9984962.1 hypothetical protein [Micavibrio sp.]HRK97353.1 hypothetical protein [Alphaproteobacteria bacterium]